MSKPWKLVGLIAAVAALSACETSQQTDDAGTTAEGTTADGTTANGTTAGGDTTGGTGASIPALVSVNLQNVLNDLSVRLNIEQANIPVNAQVPIEVAANVCGVSVSVLSVSTGGQASCTATTTSPELVQVVQQQISAGGDVGGGDQTTTMPTNNMM
jgi:hypothetical protein